MANTGESGDPRALVDLGVAAEEAGWDGFFVNDHILYHHSEWPPASPTVVPGALPARRTSDWAHLMTAPPRRDGVMPTFAATPRLASS